MSYAKAYRTNINTILVKLNINSYMYVLCIIYPSSLILCTIMLTIHYTVYTIQLSLLRVNFLINLKYIRYNNIIVRISTYQYNITFLQLKW